MSEALQAFLETISQQITWSSGSYNLSAPFHVVLWALGAGVDIVDVAFGAGHPTVSFICVLTSCSLLEWSFYVVTRSFIDDRWARHLPVRLRITTYSAVRNFVGLVKWPQRAFLNLFTYRGQYGAPEINQFCLSSSDSVEQTPQIHTFWHGPIALECLVIYGSGSWK